MQVEVRKGERNSELKASLRAKRKIYLDLATQHIRLPRNTRPAIRKILTQIVRQNFSKTLKITGFQKISKLQHKTAITYTYSYDKIDLPTKNISQILEEIGRGLREKTIRITPLQAIEVYLSFPKNISRDNALKVWEKEYQGFLKFAIAQKPITNTAFIRQKPISLTASQLPVKLSDLLTLNDAMPLNMVLCEALTEQLAKQGYQMILIKIIKFCLSAPSLYASESKVKDLALKFNIIQRNILLKNEELSGKLYREKKKFREKYFDINEFNSLSYVLNSNGTLPVVFRRGSCVKQNIGIGGLFRRFERSHSNLILLQISDWFEEHNFQTMHLIVKRQLFKSGLKKSMANRCGRNSNNKIRTDRIPKVKDL